MEAAGRLFFRRMSVITCGALERLLTAQSPHERNRSAADPPGATVDTVLYGVIRSAHPGSDAEQSRAVMPTARDDDQEMGL